MAYVITDECICCAACEPECPNKAISEAEVIFVIDPDRCTECVGAFNSPQCADVCPVNAPVPAPERREMREQLLAKWRKIHPDVEPVIAAR